ncbi:polysaccharide biosynthesis/export family protein [Novosphingobium bradum]|uniref:Polysaccharide biosynthesis/export family protein n=1 Tax=Novosphingobium bradum TaxID=1737444 RepID=A0ABV7ILH3_9SPHN
MLRHFAPKPALLARLAAPLLAVPLLVPAFVAISGCAPSALAERPPVGTFAYRIGPGDRLRIATYGEDRLTGEFTVTAQGAVAFPLLGEVAAGGQTVPEFTALLQRRLASEYMRNPQVSVEMVNFRPVYILGEVSRPGEFPYGERLSIYALVAKAGGFTYRANQGYALIRSENETVERPVRLSSATAVQPGDTIRIPERTF